MAFDDFFRAIMGQESGGNYKAVNGRTGAMGAYQILPSNIRPWSRQYLGYEISPSQFLNSPTLQDKLARSVLSAQFNRYGAAGAASWWYSGSAKNVDSTRSSHGEPSVSAYVKQVLGRMGGSYGTLRPGTHSTVDKTVKQSSLDDLIPKDEAAPGGALAGLDRTGLGLEAVEGGLGLEGVDLGLGGKAPEVTGTVGEPAAPKQDPAAMPDIPVMPPAGGQTGKWINPVGNAKFTSPYGMRNGKMHTGADWAMPIGTPLRSMANGTVIFAGNRGGKGKTVVIRYADGTESIYAHMDGFAAKAGQRVAAGTLVGYSGNTGHSTGPHLHLEISRGGKTYDPLAWMRSMGIIK